MQNIETLPRPDHRSVLRQFAADRAWLSMPITVTEIEEYVNNLWAMDQDPYRYTTD